MSSIQNANVSGVAPPETKYTKSNAFNIDEIKSYRCSKFIKTWTNYWSRTCYYKI